MTPELTTTPNTTCSQYSILETLLSRLPVQSLFVVFNFSTFSIESCHTAIVAFLLSYSHKILHVRQSLQGLKNLTKSYSMSFL